MHIALYSPNWPPAGAANGIVSYVATVREHLIGAGHKVSILSQGRLYPSDGPDVRLLTPIEELAGFDRLRRRIGRRLDQWHGGLPGFGRVLAAQVRAAHRIAPIDILEMEESYGWSHFVGQTSGVPVVTRLHGPHFLKPDTPRTDREKRTDRQRIQTEARAVRSSSTLTAPTRAIMKVTCENYRRDPGRHDAIIPNPVRIAPANDRWNAQECDRNHILMVGRFDRVKGADTMLLAFEALSQSHPQTRLTLVGPEIGIETGPGRLAGFREYARANLSPNTLKRVTLTGTLTPAQIAPLRQNASVTVVASRWENFPYALLEGFAAGCPMISTDWPGSDEIVRDGETGFLVPVGDHEVLARSLARLLDHPDLAAQVGANGLRHCATAFSIESVGNRLLDCFKATIRDSGA